MFLTALRLSGLFACPPLSMLLSLAGPGAEKAALGHEKGWGSNGKKYSIRFSKVMILKGKERMDAVHGRHY